jgi:hypothetical protein
MRFAHAASGIVNANHGIAAIGMTREHQTFIYRQIRRVADCATLCSECTIGPKGRKSNVMSINPLYTAYRADPARTALEEMESYCAEHPGSPSATRRPALSIRSGLRIAVLGPGLEEGIVGIGYTVESTLRASDTQYLAGQHSPREPDESRAAGKRAHRLIRSTPR